MIVIARHEIDAEMIVIPGAQCHRILRAEEEVSDADQFFHDACQRSVRVTTADAAASLTRSWNTSGRL